MKFLRTIFNFDNLIVTILVFLMLSTSKYKLPHYIFITFPFASILVASYLSNVSEKTLKLFSRIQIVIIQLFFAVLFVNFVFFFPPSTFVLPIICFLLLILIWYLFFKLNKIEKVIIPTTLLAISLNIVMSLNFYPNLLTYQSGSVAGRWLKENSNSKIEVYNYKIGSFAFDFYSQSKYNELKNDSISELKSKSYIYTSQEGKDELTSISSRFVVLKDFNSYGVTLLKLPFLMTSTRESKLKKTYILIYK